MTSMIAVVMFAALAANGVLSEQYRVIGEPRNGEKIPLDISLKDGYMVTVSGKPYPPQPFFVQSVNMYDFDMHLSARKVVEEDVCYIRAFTATRAQMKQVIDAAKLSRVTQQVTEVWNIPGEEIKAEELEKTVGEKIAEFCADYKVVWAKDITDVMSKKGRLVKRSLEAILGGNYDPYNGASIYGGFDYNRDRFTARGRGRWSQNGHWSVSFEIGIEF